MACCAPSAVSSHSAPARIATHSASDAYVTALYSALGVAVAAGLGYAGYRYYTDVYALKHRALLKDGIEEKRAAYPVKQVTDEGLIDQAIAEALAARQPVSDHLSTPNSSSLPPVHSLHVRV